MRKKLNSLGKTQAQFVGELQSDGAWEEKLDNLPKSMC